VRAAPTVTAQNLLTAWHPWMPPTVSEILLGPCLPWRERSHLGGGWQGGRVEEVLDGIPTCWNLWVCWWRPGFRLNPYGIPRLSNDPGENLDL
jgi:hypothetical protein